MDTEREPFLRLFLANQHRIYRFILSLVPRWGDADELFQQTSLTLWQRWDQFQADGDFCRWACGIAHNHLRNYLRKKQNQQVLLSEDVLDLLASRRLGQQGLLDDLHAALAGCLEKLPADKRQVVEQYYGEQVPVERIAEEEGRSPNAVYKLLRKVRMLLYDCVTASVGGLA